ncbi:unnamed protein product [Brugia timori]|uniref:Uncharacterized protein n=1 Tax=Brugia timori TaxID=42155 RepID=A0A0R3QHR5_9BILA|nr:unnamed protein product [Brugia timori]
MDVTKFRLSQEVLQNGGIPNPVDKTAISVAVLKDHEVGRDEKHKMTLAASEPISRYAMPAKAAISDENPRITTTLQASKPQYFFIQWH